MQSGICYAIFGFVSFAFQSSSFHKLDKKVGSRKLLRFGVAMLVLGLTGLPGWKFQLPLYYSPRIRYNFTKPNLADYVHPVGYLGNRQHELFPFKACATIFLGKAATYLDLCAQFSTACF